MTGFRLGVNNCFAVKRWPEAEVWTTLVADELGLDLVQHSLDLVDLDVTDEEIAADAATVRLACDEAGVSLGSTFTGLVAYSSNLLLSPSPPARRRATEWYRRAIAYSVAVGAPATGGHVGAFSVSDYRDPVRHRELTTALHAGLDELSEVARREGLEYLLVENLAAAREPSTMGAIRDLLTDGDVRHVPIRLCLDVGHQCVMGTSGAERDPYAWLEQMGAVAPVVQLQQTDAEADHHWPFTERTNSVGRIDANRVLEAIERSGAEEVALILEVVPSFEADDDEVLADMVASAEYWRRALTSWT